MHVCCQDEYSGAARTGFPIAVVREGEIPGFVWWGKPYQPNEEINQWARFCREASSSSLLLVWSRAE